MEPSAVFILTGAPGTGKSTLAAWLCRRLPRPVTGVQTLCTGRCAAGALFSLLNLTDDGITPCSQEEGERVLPLYNVWDRTGAAALEQALQAGAGTILVDEALPPRADCPAWSAALGKVLGSGRPVVMTVADENREALLALAPRRARLLDLATRKPEELRAELAESLPAPLHAGVSVRLFREEKCFGSGPMELLELVGRTGSLHRAAALMGMAYSKAWKMLGALEAQWGFAMLERRPGGVGGGGSLLTPRAWELLGRYRALRRETERAAEAAFARWFADF